MKLSNYFLILFAGLFIAFAGLGLNSCQTPEEEQEEPVIDDNGEGEDDTTEPSLEVAFVSSSANGATFTVKTNGITQIAYAAFAGTPEAEQTEDVLFMNGTVLECEDGESEITVSGLEPNTNYTLYVAATTVDDEYYGEVVTQDFSTGDYEEDVTMVDIGYNSFTVHVKVPESVKETGNVLRFSYGNLVMYNSNKSGWMASSDAQTLEANGGFFITNDSTIYYGPENEVYIDEYGDEIVLHDPIVPGEPIIFLVGEFTWGESMYGWGEGWYQALFDETAYQDALLNGTGDVNEEEYWTGYFYKTQIRAREPQVLNATVDVDCSNVQAVTGSIKFTPDPDVFQYCVVIVDEYSYAQILELLGNNEDYLQWFTTSYYASFMLGMRTFEGNVEIDLTEYLYLQEQTNYHILVTAMGNKEGTSQSFQHIEFSTTEKTMEAPEVTVTAIDNPNGPNDPFEVWFNVKNTGNVDVASAIYAANYERDWAAALQYMTYADVTASGNALTDEQVAQINTAEGLNLSFSTIDGMTTRLAVLAYNIEQTPNVLEEGGPAIADNTADFMPDAERVESELFSALEGEWTMTADVAHYDYYEGGYVSEGPKSIKVTVYDGINDYPETLPSEVYDYYTGMTKEEVDALYDEFKMEAEAFNARVRGQNRLLCLGFGYDTDDADTPQFPSITPYELFCNPEYSSYDVASLFYDFGPKWYLQIAEDGSVTAPFNSNRMYPLQAWTDNIYYLAALSDNGYVSVGENDSNEEFTVDIASDRNTITVNPYILDGAEMYPNAIYLNYTWAYLGGKRINSELTLTRGWTESAAYAPASNGSHSTARIQSANGVSLRPEARTMSRTSFRTAKAYKKVTDFKIVSAEEFQENLRNYQQSLAR